VFATEVLASLVVGGTVRLIDPLQKHAGGVTVPTVNGTPPITLPDLATYTAGLPREMGFAPDRPPLTWPTPTDRWSWLGREKLGWAPGTVVAYSNIGFDLLADALPTAAGKPYPELLRGRVAGPLGIKDTGFTPTPEECKRLMIGSGVGGPGPCADTAATDGSGGLYGTGEDIALWLRHNPDTTDPALLLSHAIYRPRRSLAAAIVFDDARPAAVIRLGRVMTSAHDHRPMPLEKNGVGGGFVRYSAFVLGRDAGPFVVTDRADFATFAGLASGIDDLVANLATR
jgi:serine-type D-Ala-D-Ala carboxypeptidase/endopeptidase